MFNKILFKTLIFAMFPIISIAQQTLSKQEATNLREKIVKKSQKTITINSDFIQYKHLDFLSKDIQSSGKLFFKATDRIKWEYKKPFKYSVVFKGDQLFINDDGIKSNIDLSANKAFKSLNNLIVKSVKGDMFDDEQFEILYFKNKNYLVKFNPKDKNLRSFINSFELIFDTETYNVLSIKMIEDSQDYTLIKFNNQQINIPITDAVFSN